MLIFKFLKTSLYFQFNSYPGLDYSYPIDRDDRVIVVPKPKKVPVYKQILSVIITPTTLLYCFSFFFLLTIYYFAEKVCSAENWWYSCYNFWAISLSVSSPLFFRVSNVLKPLMLAWAWASVILAVAFQVYLFRIFLNPLYEKSVDSLKDLKMIGMKIHVHRFFVEHEHLFMKKMSLKDQYLITNFTDINNKLRNKEPGAYVISWDAANVIVSDHIRKGNNSFRILQNIFIPGLRVFHLQKNSPFLGKLDQVLSKLKMAGVHRTPQFPVTEKVFQESVLLVKLNLSHLGFAFIMLLCGNLVAVLVFIVEIVYKNIQNSRRLFI